MCAMLRLLGVISNSTEFKLGLAIYWLSNLGSVNQSLLSAPYSSVSGEETTKGFGIGRISI